MIKIIEEFRKLLADGAASDQQIKDLNFIYRRYRNRRIGEYLIELHFTEGRDTNKAQRA